MSAPNKILLLRRRIRQSITRIGRDLLKLEQAIVKTVEETAKKAER